MSQAERPNLPQEPTTARRAVQTGVRLLLAAGVLLVGYWTVARFTRLLNDREPVAVPKPTAAAGLITSEPARFEALSLSQVGGSWEFLGSGWSLSVGSTNEAGREMFVSAPIDDTSILPQADPIEDWLTSLFVRLSAGDFKSPTSTTSKRSIRTPSFEAYAFEVSDFGHQRLVAARGLILMAPDQWATIEAKRAASSGADSAHPSLLPYPAQVERLAVRRNGSGAIVGEFSMTATKMEPLLELWRAAGVPVSLNDGYGVVETREGVCVQNGRALRVILWEPAFKGQTTILVLDPSAVEAVPK
ncbi:MAG: hypothetical protein JNK76_26115 [Planctomycetales bacterium]|nr:hypothetical protein [Planctomycetales bacterium]